MAFCDKQPTKAALNRAFDLCWKSDEYVYGNIEISEEDFQLLRWLSEGSIAYLDFRIGQLIDSLQREHVLDNTLVIVCADHGDCFGEHHLFLHSHHLYQQLLHVPLVVRYPGIFEGGKRITTPGQLCDIFHTTLDVTGITAKPDELGSRELPTSNRSDSADRCLVAEYIDKRAIRRGSNKLIVHEKGLRELYDLKADPGETHNRATEQSQLASDLEKSLARWMQQTKTVGQAVPDATK